MWKLAGLALALAVTTSLSAEEVPGITAMTSPARYLNRVPLGVTRTEVIVSLGLPANEATVGGQQMLQYEFQYELAKAADIFVFENDLLVDVLYRAGNRRESARERQSK
jgi:hypothetical protein